jgi:hypothetical protein
MSMWRYGLVACFSAFMGYSIAMLELEHEVCGNYTTSNSDWHGWLSIKDGVFRCFWVESRYPYRVKQGIIEVK